MTNMEHYANLPLSEAWKEYNEQYNAEEIDGCTDFTEWLMVLEYKDKKIITFDRARVMVAAALKGTAYENEYLKEYGGGDDPEDIKPFLIVRKGKRDFGATVYPEGGILFWVWGDSEDDVQEEFENVADAIAAFNK